MFTLPLQADYQSFSRTSLTCGMVLGNSTYTLRDPSGTGMYLRATQQAAAYLESTAGKRVCVYVCVS